MRFWARTLQKVRLLIDDWLVIPALVVSPIRNVGTRLSDLISRFLPLARELP